MRNPSAILIALLFAVQSWAQITVPAQTKVGEPIVATTTFEGKAYDWTSPTAKLIVVDGGKQVFIWAAAGLHRIELVAVKENYKIERFAAEFKVGDAPDPGPQPTPITLRELVTAEQATRLAEYFRSFAAVIGTYKSPAQFWSAYDATFPVKGNAQLDAALKNRLEGPVEEKKGLSTVLLAIAAEFDPQPVPPTPPPTPPPVTEGKRVVVIAQATEHEDPELDRVIVQLRKPGGPGQSFLAKAGHTLDVLDDELIRKSKWNSLLGSKLNNLPKLFIIDPQTNAILFEQTIANGTTADNIIERIRETGG